MGAPNYKKRIYSITVKNWEKYNSSKKKGHNCILLSTGFLSDAKIRMLTISGRVLFLGLLLRCGEVCANSIECSHDDLTKLVGGQGYDVSRLLSHLEELQLVSIAANDFLLDGIEKKSKEKKRIETKGELENPPVVISSRKPKAPAPEGTQLAISRYCEVWQSRYGTTPPIGRKVAGQIKNLIKDHGPKKAIGFIEAYLEMPDHWFVTKRHDIPTLLGNLNAVTQFIETGRMITKRDVANLDSSNSLRNTLDAIDRGEI